MGWSLEVLQLVSAEEQRDFSGLSLLTPDTAGTGDGGEGWKSPTLKTSGITLQTDSYTVHNETELWHTGQQASCPVFLPEATKTANLSQLQLKGLLAVLCRQNRLNAFSSWGHQIKIVANTGDNKNFQSWTILFVSWFYSQHRKILPNTGKLLAKSEWLVTICFFPLSDPSPKPTSGGGKPHWLLQALARSFSTKSWWGWSSGSMEVANRSQIMTKHLEHLHTNALCLFIASSAACKSF